MRERPEARSRRGPRGAAAEGEGAFQATLSNGLKVVAEPMPSLRSVAIGVWLVRGSRHEDDARAGMSHCIEHMLFKGTTQRSAQEIARQIDAVGGGLDAFTGKEYACYHAKALDAELPLLVDLLADLIRNPLFAQADVDRERKVIFEEIKMAEDTPDDLVHEQLVQRLWLRHPLGRPILGTRATVGRFDSRAIRRFWGRVYGPANLLISVAGRFERARLMDLLERHFGPHRLDASAASEQAPSPRPVFVVKHKEDLEQAHLCAGVNGLPHSHPDRTVAHVLNTVLGGSMSSRLFQSIREERGLVYSVGSYLNSYRDAGYLMVQAGCSPRNLREVVRLTVEGITDLTTNLLSDEELARTKGHLEGNLMLGLEGSGARMSNIARQEMYFGRQFSLDEMLGEIDRVTAADVRRVARQLFSGRTLQASLLGKVKGLRLEPRHFRIPD